MVFATFYMSHKMVCDIFLSQCTSNLIEAHPMPRVTPSQELDKLVELIGSAPDSVGIETI